MKTFYKGYSNLKIKKLLLDHSDIQRLDFARIQVCFYLKINNRNAQLSGIANIKQLFQIEQLVHNATEAPNVNFIWSPQVICFGRQIVARAKCLIWLARPWISAQIFCMAQIANDQLSMGQINIPLFMWIVTIFKIRYVFPRYKRLSVNED